MATLATQQIVPAGITPAFAAAAAGGDKVAPGDNTYLEAVNGSGAPITVTVDSTQACSQGVDHNLIVVIAAAARAKIGPLPAGRYAGTDGLVAVTYSGVTSLTVGAFRF